MLDSTIQRMTGKELAELLRVTPSAISRAVLNDTLVRDIAPVAMWADLDPDSDRVRGFDVPIDDAEMLRQMALAGQFASGAGAIPRAIAPQGRSTDGFPASFAAPLAPVQPLAPPAPSRSDADIERVVNLLQQQIEARDAENERLRQVLVRTEQETSAARSEHLRAMDELRERMARMRDEHADAAAKLRDDLAQARLDLRAYEAGAEPTSDAEGGSIWEQLATEYAQVLVPAAAGLLSSLGARMQPQTKPLSTGTIASAASGKTSPSATAPTPDPQAERMATARPAESPEVAATVAAYLVRAALDSEGERFGPYLNQLMSALTLDDWKAIASPLLADMATRDAGALAHRIAPALLARWSVAFDQTPEDIVGLATAMGLVHDEHEQATLHGLALALRVEAESLARASQGKTRLRKPAETPPATP